MKQETKCLEYVPSGENRSERKARRRISPPGAAWASAAAEDKQTGFPGVSLHR